MFWEQTGASLAQQALGAFIGDVRRFALSRAAWSITSD